MERVGRALLGLVLISYGKSLIDASSTLQARQSAAWHDILPTNWTSIISCDLLTWLQGAHTILAGAALVLSRSSGTMLALVCFLLAAFSGDNGSFISVSQTTDDKR